MLFCPPGIRAAKLTLLQADPFVKQKFCACCSLLWPSIIVPDVQIRILCKTKVGMACFPPPSLAQANNYNAAAVWKGIATSISRTKKENFSWATPPPNPPAPPHGHDFWRYSCMESMEISIFSDYVYFPFISLF